MIHIEAVEDELAAQLHAQWGADPTPQDRKHLEFALSNRKRGKGVLDRVVSRTGIDLRGKRVLDVGCAYGGFVIEAAGRGAEAWGVEVNRRLYDYGVLNARGEKGDIHLVHCDFLSVDLPDRLPRGYDLVLVNDVLEHVYDTAGLLKHLHLIMKPGAPFMFSIPNGDAVTAVLSEGHMGTPGITQLPANRWHYVVPSFTAYYRPWSSYSGLFRAFGFNRIDVWRGKPIAPRELIATIEQGLADAKAAVAAMDLDKRVRPFMKAAMQEYEARVRADLKIGDMDTLQWRYVQTFWKGCAYKSGPVIADIAEKPCRDPLSPRKVGRKLLEFAVRARSAVRFRAIRER